MSRVALKILFCLVQCVLTVIIHVLAVEKLQHHALNAKLIFIDYEVSAIILVRNFITHNYQLSHVKIVILNAKYVQGRANALFVSMERLQQMDYVKFNAGQIA